MATKNVAAKTAKKVAAPKPAKVAKPGSEKTSMKPRVELVSFSVSAVIPTQQYGNIQPRIEVKADSIEEARAVVMPIIEDLYQAYAEMPLNGREPKFFGKIQVEEKIVSPAVQTAPTSAPKAQDVPAPVTTAQKASEAPSKPKSEPVLKAEKAISLAMSNDALIAIGQQIQKSVKIDPEDKPDLQILVLKRRNDFK